MLAGGDLGVASTRGGGFVLAGRFWGWRAPGEAVWCLRRHRLVRRTGVGIGIHYFRNIMNLFLGECQKLTIGGCTFATVE